MPATARPLICQYDVPSLDACSRAVRGRLAPDAHREESTWLVPAGPGAYRRFCARFDLLAAASFCARQGGHSKPGPGNRCALFAQPRRGRSTVAVL